MSSNPLLNDKEQLIAEEGEWRGLAELLRGYADGDPESATAGTELEPDSLARRYADFVDPDTEFQE